MHKFKISKNLSVLSQEPVYFYSSTHKVPLKLLLAKDDY